MTPDLTETTAYWKYTQHVYENWEDDIKNVFKESDGWVYSKTPLYPNPYKICDNKIINHIALCPVCYNNGKGLDACRMYASREDGKTRAIMVSGCPEHYPEYGDEESKEYSEDFG